MEPGSFWERGNWAVLPMKNKRLGGARNRCIQEEESRHILCTKSEETVILFCQQEQRVSNKSSSVSVISIFVQFCDVLPLHLDAFDTAMIYSCSVFPDSFEYSLLPSTR